MQSLFSKTQLTFYGDLYNEYKNKWDEIQNKKKYKVQNKKEKIKRDSHERGGERERGKIIRGWRCNLKNKIHKLE